jgi:hypothetical protein
MLEVFVSETRWTMKTIITLLVSAIMALTTMAPLAVSADMLMPPPDKPRYELRGPLNDYYIGIHRPDGSCQTVEVYATTYDEAVKIVKKNRCDFCVLDDKTPYFTSGSADVIKQVNRTCPR